MKTFIKSFRHYKETKSFFDEMYQFCWCPIDTKTGTGLYITMNTIGIDKSKLDPNKLQIII